jgi:hypothetical protein
LGQCFHESSDDALPVTALLLTFGGIGQPYLMDHQRRSDTTLQLAVTSAGEGRRGAEGARIEKGEG